MSEWQPVEKNHNYEVSDAGSVRRADNCIALKQWLNSNGYPMVRLSRPRTQELVHRLVAKAFCDNPLGLPFVNHIDNNPTSNAAVNLEWCTQQGNLSHSRAQGRMLNYWSGKRSPNAKISDETVIAIRAAYIPRDFSLQKLANEFGLSKRSVGRIISGESYANV